MKPKDDLEWDDLCQEDQDFIEAITKFAENSEMDANTIIGRIESIRDTQRQQTAQEIFKELEKEIYVTIDRSKIGFLKADYEKIKQKYNIKEE